MAFVRNALRGVFIGGFFAWTPVAHADMGRAPVGPGGIYVSVFGGYVNSDGPETAGHQPNGGSSPAVLLSVDDGDFIGGTLGIVLRPASTPYLGFINLRVEGSYSVSHFNDDTITSAGSNISLRNLTCPFPPPATCGGSSLRANGVSRQERKVQDGALTIKGDKDIGNGATVTGGIEFFIRDSEDETFTHTFGGLPERFRTADVDADFYGVMAVLQPEVPVGRRVSLVGDFAAGIYEYDADAVFTRTNNPTIVDSKSETGFRGRALGGLKINIAPHVTGTLFGGVNYWSEVPFGRMPAINSEPQGFTSQIQSDDLTELIAGGRLTFSLGGSAN